MPLVVISGCDGAGKSAIAHALSARSSVYRIAHWSDFANRLGLADTAASLIRDMEPVTRAHFLLFLNWGLHEQIIKPMLGHGNVVLCESYYFKFLAKERVLQLAELELIEGLRLLPAPDLIVDVSTQPEVAFTRIAASLNEYETLTGMANWGDFRHFQVRVRRELDTIVRATRVPVLAVDGSNEVALASSYIHDWITGHLQTGPAEL